MAFLRLCAAVLAVVVLAGCGGAPQCNDDWVKETVTELLVESYRERSASFKGKEAFLSQKFELAAVRTLAQREDLGSSTCEAQLHGRKAAHGSDSLSDEAVTFYLSYETYLTDDGEHYVRLLTWE